MSELNYASTLAALDDEFASASASTGSGSVPVGRYNAMIKEAKIVARTGGGLALSVSLLSHRCNHCISLTIVKMSAPIWKANAMS